MNLSTLRSDTPKTIGFGVLGGARVDKDAELVEQRRRYQHGIDKYRFVTFLREVSDGTITVENFDQHVDFVVRDEDELSPASVCAQVIEQFEREPHRMTSVEPGVVVRLQLFASKALV